VVLLRSVLLKIMTFHFMKALLYGRSEFGEFISSITFFCGGLFSLLLLFPKFCGITPPTNIFFNLLRNVFGVSVFCLLEV